MTQNVFLTVDWEVCSLFSSASRASPREICRLLFGAHASLLVINMYVCMRMRMHSS